MRSKILLKNQSTYSKKNRILTIFFCFILILLLLFAIVNVSDIISSIITQKKSLFYVDRIESTSYSVYAVSLNDFDNEELASDFASQISKKGAMGRVYKSGEYFVIGACYPTLIEAQEIRDNLLSSGFKSRIINMRVDAVRKEYRGSDKSIIQESLLLPRKNYKALYEINLNFDRKQISRSKLNGQVAKIISKNMELLSALKKNKKNFSKANCADLLNYVEKINDKLRNLLLFNNSELELTSFMKNVMLDIVFINQEMIENF